MNGKTKDSERKAVETFFSNTYTFDKFFGREIIPIDKSENWSVEQPEFLDDFKYSSGQPELADFSKWLIKFEQTEKFKSVAERFTQAQMKLKYEKDLEMRHYLIRIDEQLLSEFYCKIAPDRLLFFSLWFRDGLARSVRKHTVPSKR
jgi:hypothetical protein